MTAYRYNNTNASVMPFDKSLKDLENKGLAPLLLPNPECVCFITT